MLITPPPFDVRKIIEFPKFNSNFILLLLPDFVCYVCYIPISTTLKVWMKMFCFRNTSITTLGFQCQFSSITSLGLQVSNSFLVKRFSSELYKVSVHDLHIYATDFFCPSLKWVRTARLNLSVFSSSPKYSLIVALITQLTQKPQQWSLYEAREEWRISSCSFWIQNGLWRIHDWRDISRIVLGVLAKIFILQKKKIIFL